MGRSLVQRSPAECDVPTKYNRESLVRGGHEPKFESKNHRKKKVFHTCDIDQCRFLQCVLKKDNKILTKIILSSFLRFSQR